MAGCEVQTIQKVFIFLSWYCVCLWVLGLVVRFFVWCYSSSYNWVIASSVSPVWSSCANSLMLSSLLCMGFLHLVVVLTSCFILVVTCPWCVVFSLISPEVSLSWLSAPGSSFSHLCPLSLITLLCCPLSLSHCLLTFLSQFWILFILSSVDLVAAKIKASFCFTCVSVWIWVQNSWQFKFL